MKGSLLPFKSAGRELLDRTLSQVDKLGDLPMRTRDRNHVLLAPSSLREGRAGNLVFRRKGWNLLYHLYLGIFYRLNFVFSVLAGVFFSSNGDSCFVLVFISNVGWLHCRGSGLLRSIPFFAPNRTGHGDIKIV